MILLLAATGVLILCAWVAAEGARISDRTRLEMDACRIELRMQQRMMEVAFGCRHANVVEVWSPDPAQGSLIESELVARLCMDCDAQLEVR